MRLTFLGSGGGRWVVLRQLKASGGFVLELSDQKMHVDPGPGALVRAKVKEMASRASFKKLSKYKPGSSPGFLLL